MGWGQEAPLDMRPPCRLHVLCIPPVRLHFMSRCATSCWVVGSFALASHALSIGGERLLCEHLRVVGPPSGQLSHRARCSDLGQPDRGGGVAGALHCPLACHGPTEFPTTHGGGGGTTIFPPSEGRRCPQGAPTNVDHYLFKANTHVILAGPISGHNFGGK